MLLVSPGRLLKLCATYGARIVSAVTNFFLNRLLVFQDKSAAGQSIWRYAVLAVVQANLSAVLVSVLQGISQMHKPARNGHQIPVDGVLFLANYQIQKRWVFRQRTDTPDKKKFRMSDDIRNFYVSISILRKYAAPARASRPQR